MMAAQTVAGFGCARRSIRAQGKGKTTMDASMCLRCRADNQGRLAGSRNINNKICLLTCVRLPTSAVGPKSA
jgi:hypothetical protein